MRVEGECVVPVHDSILEVKYPAVLKLSDHIAIGSSASLKMIENPNMAAGVLYGQNPRIIASQREEQSFIAVQAVSEFIFGINAREKTVLLKLPPMDTDSQEITGDYDLFGVFVQTEGQGEFGDLITDHRDLNDMGVTMVKINEFLNFRIEISKLGPEELLSN